LPPQNCPACGQRLNRSAGDAQRPREGDLTICMRCTAPLMFSAGLLLVKAQLDSLSPEFLSDIRHLQQAIKAFRKAAR